MFTSSQGQYTSTPTPSGGALVDSSESDAHESTGGSTKATSGRTHRSTRTNPSKKSAKHKAKSRASAAGKRPEAGAEASQVDKASRVLRLNGLSFVSLFEEYYESSNGGPRTLAELFADWAIPEGVGEVRDIKTGVVSYKPVITKRLAGGETAATDLWQLLYEMAREGNIFHSAAVASGNFWEVKTEAELTIESLAKYDEFKAMYRNVEGGPLNAHFTGHLGQSQGWDFSSLAAGRAANPVKLPGHFFDCLSQALASLMLSRQQDINGRLRPAAQRQVEENPTAGLLAPKRGQEGPWRCFREARAILRRIGTPVPPNDPDHPFDFIDEDLLGATEEQLRLALYVSPSTIQLAKELLITVDLEPTAFGVRRLEVRDKDAKVKVRACALNFSVLAHAATMVESELLTLQNLPHHHGRSRYDAAIHLNYSNEEIKMLAAHKEALELLQGEAALFPEGRLAPLIAIVRALNADFKLYRIDYSHVYPSVSDAVRM